MLAPGDEMLHYFSVNVSLRLIVAVDRISISWCLLLALPSRPSHTNVSLFVLPLAQRLSDSLSERWIPSLLEGLNLATLLFASGPVAKDSFGSLGRRSRPLIFRAFRFRKDSFQVRSDQSPEIGPVGQISLSSEEFPANFVFEFLDCPGKRRRRYVTFLGGSTEIQKLAYGKKVAYLMHFHLGQMIRRVPLLNSFLPCATLVGREAHHK